MKLTFVLALAVICYMQLDSAGGQGGEDVPTVGDLANKVSKMEDEVESLTVYVNTINTDVEKVNDSVFNMESILGSRMFSWDSFLDNLVAQSKSTDGSINTDKGCIFGLDGGQTWTTTIHQYAFAMSDEERADIARLFKAKDFTPFMMSGVVAAGVNYQFIQGENDKLVHAKKNGEGAITIEASKTAIVIGHCPEGRDHGNNNKAVGMIAGYLELLGM